jgi:glycosyltransferase involved in cell wall biosynthesis
MLDPAQLTPYYNIALCDALALAGCNVRYITSDYLYDGNLPFTSNFTTDYQYFRGLNNPRLINYPRLRRLLRGISYPFNHWQLLRQLRVNPPDVLHIQWSRMPRVDHWLIQQVRAAGVPVIHTIHDVIPLYAPDANTKPLQTVYEEVDRIILHTEANRGDFLQTYPTVDLNRIVVIPLISTPNTALPTNATRPIARTRLSLPHDAPVFVFFGSVRHYKGVDTLLTAFAQAVASHPNLHLVIAGKPDTEEDNQLLERARSQSNVHVYSGYIPYEEVWQYYIAADVMVLPYRAITQSAALISSMEFGRAVIVTDVGGLPETVAGNGWIVPPEDANALATVILDAASDLERVRKMGERSSTLIQQKYTGSAVAQATLELYKQLSRSRG